LSDVARQAIAAEGADHISTLTLEPSLDVRYVGQGYELTVSLAGLTEADADNWRNKVKRLFDEQHQALYKYHDPSGEIEVLSLRITALRKTEVVALHVGRARGNGPAPIVGSRMAMFPGEEGAREASIYRREDLLPGHKFSGPAIVEEYGSTSVIPPRCEVEIDELENIIIRVEA
jgi:N-methylhydantoinase A